jgi:hypothetical protein
MVNREDIREYFSRYFLGRIPVHSHHFNDNEVNIIKINRNIEVHGKNVKARIVSPLKYTCGRLACVTSGIKIENLCVKVLGDKIKSYASGEIHAKKISLKFSVKLRKWRKEFALLPQERRNRLLFISKKDRIIDKNELNLAYFQPIIHDNVAKLVLNKQDGSLLIWYNSTNRNYNPKGLYMYKCFGEKDINWRWVDIKC